MCVHTCLHCHSAYVHSYLSTLSHGLCAFIPVYTVTRPMCVHTCLHCHSVYVRSYLSTLSLGLCAFIPVYTVTRPMCGLTCLHCHMTYVRSYLSTLSHGHINRLLQFSNLAVQFSLYTRGGPKFVLYLHCTGKQQFCIFCIWLSNSSKKPNYVMVCNQLEKISRKLAWN